MLFKAQINGALAIMVLSGATLLGNDLHASGAALQIGLSTIQNSANEVHQDLLAPKFRTVLRTAHSDILPPSIMEMHASDLKKSPVNGNTTSDFGYRVHPIYGSRKKHNGVDFGGDYGTPVVAASAGIVTKRAWVKGYGNVVYVDHGNGLQTRYAHLQSFAIVNGEKVFAGQLVGKVGATGRATGPHLHFEARINGRPTNPKRLFANELKKQDESKSL